MRISLVIALLLTLGFLACAPHKPGSGIYFYTSFLEGDPNTDTALNFVSFLQLRPDGSYAQDFGHYDYGSWSLKEDRLYLTNQRRRTYVYRVISLTNTKLVLRLDSGTTGSFRVHHLPSTKPEEDPFSLYNNHWRIPATHKESDAEIRNRLYNHCQFWEAFYKWVDDKNEGLTDISEFPSPLKIYGNGFGLRHYDKLSAAWKACFFDEDDCRKADTLIKHTFRRNTIKWPETKSDYEKMIGGFQQLQQFLR
jgi:hypothetical protein